MHSILKAAIDAAPPDLRTSPPHHGGVDANPQLTNFGCCGVAIFMAEACAPFVVDVIEEEQVEDWLRAAKNIYSLHARAIGTEVKPYTKTKLRVLSDKELKAAQRKIVVETAAPSQGRRGRNAIILTVPSRAANGALYAAIDVEVVGGGPYVLSALKMIAGQVVATLPRKRVTSFLRELDTVLLREELRAVFVQRRDPRCELIEACVWRAAGVEKARQGRASGAKITHWIGRLKDGSYVLLWKVGARWQTVFGDRNHVLASVTDEQMQSAVDVLV